MNDIEKYIDFALKNNFIHNHMNTIKQLVKYWDINDNDKTDKYTLHWLIQTKEFIEAVARWLINFQSKWQLGDTYNLDFNDRIRYITFEQAIAIRENKLWDFITNLLPKWKI